MSHHFWPYSIDADEAPPLDADRYLVWLARHQWRTILGGVLFGVPWMLSIALVPAAIGKAIDGLVAHDEKALLVWSGAIMGLGLVSAVTTDGRHWFAVRNWLIASFRTAVVTERAVRRAGPALTRRMPAGEVVTSFASDFWRIGNAYDVTARMAGAIVSFLVVSVILLRGSVVLGVIMLVGGPVLLASLTLVMRPLQRRQAAQRHEAGLLTSLGADTVAGLRVLRGIGGEDTFLTRYAAQSGRVRGAGVRLSGIQATLDAAQVLLPGIFVIIVTGVGAHLAVAGDISPGQLVAFYGYTAFLTMPLRTATEFVDKTIRARVGARRVVTILGVEPDHSSTATGATLNGHVVDLAAPLVDPVTGVVIEPGKVTALVSARPEETSALAHRLGRTRPGRHGVRWGAVPLDDLPVDAVRSRVVVSEADPHLFSGPVREALGGASDEERHAAVWVTSASDALEALEHGMDGELEERGRALSGGQRQRVALARALLRDHRGPLSWVLGWHVVAALVALVGPWVIGQVVQEVTTGDGSLGRIDRLIALLVAAIVVQTVLTWVARRASFVLSERIFARLREDFITSSVRLPLSVVERAGTGDLVARTTNDVESLAHIIRFGIPAIVVAVTTVVATTVAAFLTSPLAALSLLTAALVHVPTSRWYLKRAGDGYLWEHASYARLNGVASETVEGAHTMDALGLQAARGRRFQDALDECGDAERYTLGLRLRWFPWLEIGFFLPIATAVLWGGWLAWNGHITIAAATAVTLYVQQLLDPLGELISWLDEIQFAATSLARILGVSEVPPDRVATGATPDGEQVDVDDVRYSYRAGRDVLHGVSLGLVPGERLAIVGPSGAGKSTLGRLMAGIDGPRTGRVTGGGVPLVDLALPVLRGEVALVTQEHHVFVGTLADNLRLPRPEAAEAELREALAAVDALDWADALPDGLDTVVGSGGHALTEAQAQQLALARLVLADPHTLVLDEATSLLDPRAARHLERSLAAVVDGRTVVAIAHRLHTAHDADRVAVVEDGVVTELGTHDELIEADGAYAALWRSWRDEPRTSPAGR